MRAVVCRTYILAALAAWVVAGCGNETPETSGTSVPARDTSPRIVSFGPNVTEVLFELGVGDAVVGVTRYDEFPAEVKDIAQVGDYVNPDFEKLSVLNPDLLFVQGKSEKIQSFADDNGITCIHVNMDSLASIDAGIRIVGEAVGRQKEADALCARIEHELDAVRAAVKDKPPVSALILTGRQDLSQIYTVGGSSFLSEIAEVAGARNIYRDSTEPYLQASKETVVLKAPEAIIEFYTGAELDETGEAEYIAEWNELPTIPAVAEKRVILLTGEGLMTPSPRITATARELARRLHPDITVAEP